MYPALTLLVLILLGAMLFRMPREFLRRYLATFAERHGFLFQVGFTMLATLTAGTLLVTLLHPGRTPQMEQVNAAVVAVGAILFGIDLYLYAQSLGADDSDGGDLLG